jgi:hypothetical protein
MGLFRGFSRQAQHSYPQVVDKEHKKNGGGFHA